MSTRKVKDAIDLETNEKVYLKGHAKATYMSDGRNVEDAINEVSSGGGGGSASGGSVSIPIIEHGENDTTITISPNTYHKWSDVKALNITLEEPSNSGIVNEYMFSFDNYSVYPPSITLPELHWEYGIPTFNFYAKNVVIIKDGMAKVDSYSFGPVYLKRMYDAYDKEDLEHEQKAQHLFEILSSLMPGDYQIDSEIYIKGEFDYLDSYLDIKEKVLNIRATFEFDYDYYFLYTEHGSFVLNEDGTVFILDYEIQENN